MLELDCLSAEGTPPIPKSESGTRRKRISSSKKSSNLRAFFLEWIVGRRSGRTRSARRDDRTGRRSRIIEDAGVALSPEGIGDIVRRLPRDGEDRVRSRIGGVPDLDEGPLGVGDYEINLLDGAFDVGGTAVLAEVQIPDVDAFPAPPGWSRHILRCPRHPFW